MHLRCVLDRKEDVCPKNGTRKKKARSCQR
jgi:hypothetical protein